MKISTRGRYALRLMLDLALADPEEYCSVKSIAARQQISEKYMEQIISQLVKAGFVRSVRGAQGGYRLAYILLMVGFQSQNLTGNFGRYIVF